MPDIQQADILGNYLSQYRAAQQYGQAQQDRALQQQRQATQDQYAQQEHDWEAINRKNEMVARTALAADTPEKWAAVVPQAAQQLGWTGPIPGFDQRERIISESMSLKDQIAQKMQERQFALNSRVAEANIRQSDAAAAKDRAQAANVGQGGPGGMNNQTFDNISGLRKEFVNSTKTYQDVRDAFGRIQESARNPSAAGDLSLIFNYMKVLDPGSTVREGEFATAQNATGVPERILNAYNNAIKGERLNPAQRSDFVNRAGALFNRQHQTYLATKGHYDQLAKDFGFDPKFVTYDMSAGLADQPPAPPSFVRGGAGIFDQGGAGQQVSSQGQAIPPPPPGARIIR